MAELNLLQEKILSDRGDPSGECAQGGQFSESSDRCAFYQ